MSPCGATARAPTPAFAAHVDPSFVGPGGLPAGSRIPIAAVGLARRPSEPRTPSIGSMLGLATKWCDCAIPFTFARYRPAPFRSARRSSPRQGYELPRRATPGLRRSPFGNLEGTRRRCYSPTSATDLTTRAPVNRPTLGREAFAVTDLHRALLRFILLGWTSAHFAMPASNYLAVAQPRVDARLTAPIELRPRRSQPVRSFLRRAEHRSGRCSHCHGVFDRGQGWRRTPLTPHVAPREYPETRASSRGTRIASTAIAFNDDGFPDPRRLPSTSAP